MSMTDNLLGIRCSAVVPVFNGAAVLSIPLRRMIIA